MHRALFHRSGDWDPLQDRTQINLFDQNTGLPYFLEPDEVSWIDAAKKRLGASTWPGSLRLPLFSSLYIENPLSSNTRTQGQTSDSVCEQTTGKSWKVCLNVNRFSPEDISIKTKEGYLEITGNREERQENQRLISRSFTRKYKLPADLKQLSSTLSPDGILSVEAPSPASDVSLTGETVIPIHMMEKQDLPEKQ